MCAHSTVFLTDSGITHSVPLAIPQMMPFPLVQHVYCGLHPTTHLPRLFAQDPVLDGCGGWQLGATLSLRGVFWCSGGRTAVPAPLRFAGVHSQRVGKRVQYLHQVKRVELVGTVRFFAGLFLFIDVYFAVQVVVLKLQQKAERRVEAGK